MHLCYQGAKSASRQPGLLEVCRLEDGKKQAGTAADKLQRRCEMEDKNSVTPIAIIFPSSALERLASVLAAGGFRNDAPRTNA